MLTITPELKDLWELGRLRAVMVSIQTFSGDENNTMYVQREDQNWALNPVTEDAPDQACDCCPHTLLMLSDGDALLSYRHEVDDVRNMYAARIYADGSPPSWAQSSFTDWVVFQCPVQGPRLAELADGAIVQIWSDASSGAYRLYQAVSNDGGLSWASEQMLNSEMGAVQKDPRIAVTDDGVWWLTYLQNGAPPQVMRSTDEGLTWDGPEEVVVPSGALLGIPQLVSFEDTTAIVVDASGDGIWLIGLE